MLTGWTGEVCGYRVTAVRSIRTARDKQVPVCARCKRRGSFPRSVYDGGPVRFFVVKENPSLERACVLSLVRFPGPGECLSCHLPPRPIVVVLCGGVAAGRAQAA